MPASYEPADAPQVAQLAAKVAHELNNPLDAVLRFVSLAQRKAHAGNYSEVERHLADAQFGLERMAETLRELMELGRQAHEIAASSLIPLDTLIAHALRTTAAQAEQNHIIVRILNAIPPGKAPRFDASLSQVVANLLKNAIEASPANAQITLESQLAADSLRLTITDAGPGIPADVLLKLFTPFITTKPKGAGHGLGLAISREITLSLGGTLTLENHPPTGCIATIRLPLARLNDAARHHAPHSS